MASPPHHDGDFVVAGPSGTKPSGNKRSFAEVDDNEDDIFGPKKLEETAPGVATGMIPTLRESLQKCKDDDLAKFEVPRYLLVSNGCAIFVLDLKPKESSDDPIVRVIPEKAILDLIEEKLPVSVGLFRFGSDACIFGGHMFDTAVDPLYKLFFLMERSTDNPSNIKLYRYQLLTRCLKGTSCATYRLTLEEDCNTLSYSSKCKIKELNSPKFWPTAEEVDGQIHVFDSNPCGIAKPDFGWNFSHEVLGRDGWSEIVTTNVDLQNHFIHRHLVLGHQIYATAGRKCLLFDSKKNKWEEVDYKRGNDWDLSSSSVNWVWDILLLYGSAWNVGEIGLGDDRLYVILLFQFSYGETSVIAYLVSPKMGEVVCRQFLHDFFPAGAPIRPCVMVSATVIKAAQDSDGKTMCAVLNAHAPFDVDSSYQDSYLLVYTFTLKEISGAVSKLKAKQSSAAISWEFVRAVVKDSYIFKPDELDDHVWCYMHGIQACFIEGER